MYVEGAGEVLPMKLFIALVLVLSGSYANAGVKTRTASAKLDYQTNLGIKKSFNLVIKKNDVIVDGNRLNATQKSWAAPYLTRLLQTSSTLPLNPCAAGTFTHTVRVHGKKSVERGCLDSIAFAELNRSFEMLEKPGF